MTICCFPNVAYLSETSRMIAVYRRLVEAGEQPLVATHGGTYEFVLEQEGIPFERAPPFMSRERAQAFVAANRRDAGPRRFFRFYDTDELRAHVRAEIELFERQDVRAVLTGWTLSTALSTRAAGVPLATSHLGSCVPPALGKLGLPGLPPAMEQRLLRLVPERRLAGFYERTLRLALGHLMRPYNTIAAELGVAPFTGLMDLMLGDLTLVTDTPEILGIPRDRLERWRPPNPRAYRRTPRLRYVGAMYAQLFGGLLDDVRRFLDTDIPTVYVALTSSRKDYLSDVCATLQDLKVRSVVVSTVHDLDLAAAPNMLVRPHLPSHAVMPLVDLAIIHGGQGSVQTAIAAGVPVLGFPLHGEQYLNLKLVERHGAGRCQLSLKAARKARFRSEVEQILADPSFKANMHRLQTLQARFDGPTNTARAVQELSRGADPGRSNRPTRE